MADIGQKSYIATQETLQQVLNKLNSVATDIATVNQNVDSVKTNVDNVNNTAASQESLNQVLTALNSSATKSDMTALQNRMTSELAGVGAVKSVQRGITGMSSRYIDITISDVDMSKAFLNVQNGMVYGSTDPTEGLSASYVGSGYIKSTNQVRIMCSTTDSRYCILWEVIEFK